MSTPATPAGPEISYAIAYEAFAGRDYNPELRGPGRLVIRLDGPAYVFSGKRRALFTGGPVEQAFTAGDIWNVAVAGRAIWFHARNWGSPKPFYFLCRDEREAAEVARLLPPHRDEDFVASLDFAARLHALPSASRPWTSVTNLLIALNIAAFVVMGVLGAGWIQVESMKPYVLYGANNGAATTDGEWWRLVTCMFLHYGILHLALNMWALYQVGHLLERLLGRTLYALAYLGSGVIASLASILWHGDKLWSAGASGAVFGVYGALLGYLLREKHGVPKAVFQPMLRSTLTFAGYNIFYGMVHPSIDNSAHIGGLLGGLGLGWLVALPIDPVLRRQVFARKLQAGLLTAAALIAAGVALTPRFDYSPADEMQWGEATEEFTAKEPAIGARQDKEWREFIQTGRNQADYARWIEGELIPDYEKFLHQLAALQPRPGRAITRRRDVVLQYAQLRLEGYRHLLAGVRDHNDAELKAYVDCNQRAAAELEKLPESGK